ncbi:hypothetical protein QBZ16_000597 [Prototheca wickerhamii]|uniref:Rab-GAP TBC domain-containing protein n=1 Tax=Prototheca wickerhamii TaxID=3111 RepID=A0AAD9IN17_PROWI|nr:hypothetical protein QBZ16_000597 [Prototheca wickerhamii]
MAERKSSQEEGPPRFGSRLATFASGVGGALARTAASAGVLLSDAHLRKQGASVLTAGASRGLRNVQQGVTAGIHQLQMGQKQLRDALVQLQQRTERERLAGLLREDRERLVDVQVGFQVHEESPQELRSKLWMALLEHPEFSRQYTALLPEPTGSPGALNVALGPETARDTDEAGDLSPRDDVGGQEQPLGAGSVPSGRGSPAEPEVGEPPHIILGNMIDDDQSAQEAARLVRRMAEQAIAGEANQAAADGEAAPAEEGLPVGAGSFVNSDGRPTESQTEIQQEQPSSASGAIAEEAGHESDQDDLALDEPAPSPEQPSSPSTASLAFTPTPASSVRADSPLRDPVDDDDRQPSATPSSAPRSEEEWEVVRERRPRLEGAALLDPAIWRAAAPRFSLEREAFRNSLMAAMLAVPWPLPAGYPPDCRYATLLQISIGQEDVDDVISRDIHRTFPEHALFGSEAGRSSLFRVGYCQGMAFVAGLLLFYLPEEPAFQVLCRLLAASGPNLRRFYLPGLTGLKADLMAFDALLRAHLPTLWAHLRARGVVPVLYASQWLLTAFACPMPAGFACRVIDALLLEGDSWVLARVALALMAECEADLLLRDDFEDLLTYLKLEPMAWPAHRLRRVLDAALSQARALPRPEGFDDEAGEDDERLRAAASAPQPTDAVDEELARQRAEMDADFVGMVLELDTLFAPEEGLPSPASDSFDEHPSRDAY